MLVLNMMLVLSDISYKFRDINKILLSIMENLLPWQWQKLEEYILTDNLYNCKKRWFLLFVILYSTIAKEKSNYTSTLYINQTPTIPKPKHS